jgi:catechol 1,2-dioxygenase
MSGINATPNRFDPNFTKNVIDAMGPNVAPRTRQLLGAMLRHVHDFAREVELTRDEWMASVQFLNAVGQISNSKRNEMHRISDIIGLES